MDASVLMFALMIYAATFGGLSMWIATQKNRDQGEGIILGLLFGPFGCLIEALMPAGTYTPPSEPHVPTSLDAETIARIKANQSAYQDKLRKERAAVRAREANADAFWAVFEKEKARERAEAKARRDKSYRARGIEPGPFAWFKLWPEWLQATLLGLAVPSPIVMAIVAWQVYGK
jgi:muconolactone delta-isomerase